YPEEKNGYVEILLSGAGNQVDQDVWSNTMAQQWGICLSTGTATHDITNLFNQYAYNDACPSGFQCEVRIPMYELKTQFGINYGDPIYISGFILDENHSLTVGLKTFKEEAGNVDVGGIRVEKTFTDDKNGNVITKNFNYNTSDLGFSSGVVIGEKKYVRKQLNPFGDYTAIMNPGGDPCGDHSCTNQRNMYSDNSVVPLESTLGSHIGYVVVEEYQVGNGKTVCQYRVSSGNTAGIFDYPIPSWSQSDLLNGRLENEKIFDESGNLVKEVTFKYSLNQTKSLNLQSIYSGTSTPCIPAVIGDVNWGADQALLEVYANLDACISFDGGQTWTYQPEYYLILQNYQLKTGYVVLDEKTEVLDGVTKHITFQYDNQWRHGNPTEIKAQNSDGVFGIEKFVYASELEITANPWNWQEEALEYMNQNNINLPIETSQWIKKPGQTEKCINSALKLYKKSNQNLINLSRVWTTEFTTPSVDFEQVKISSSGGFLEKDPAYQTHGENVPVVQLHHNNHGNLETQTLAFGQPSCLIWNADNFFPLANVDNADIHEVAYTSFESTDNEGGWTFNNMTSNVAFAGLLSKNLNQGPVQKTSLFKGNYLISFWQRSGVVNIVVNGSVVASFNGTNNFEKRQIELSLPLNTNNQIEVSGTSLIDELRLCPSDALMATTVFDKDNVILAKLDENNNVISQFEYDDFNRLGIVRDMFGNIIKSYEYVYDQDMGLSSITTKIPRIEGVTSLQDLANLDPDEMSHNVQYIDGLGRTLQSISVKGSPSKKDIVSMLKYNDLGRMDKSYLSFTRFSNDGSFFPNAELLQNLFYGSISDAKAYEEMEYDLSPLNRVIKLARPGSNMAMGSGHEIETVFRSNTLNEVRLFTSSGVSTGFYAPNTLFAVETINENEHKLITYTDLRGREILRDNEGFKTYTIYDDFGRKSWVVPPKALAQMEASGQYICNLPTINPGLFSYLYNAQGLVARKKLPGADQVRFYYNRQNLLVNKIDGNDNQHFTKYDILGRPILEGLYQGSALPANTDGLFESATSSGHGYTTSNSFPSSNIEIHKVTYYDHYDFNRDGQEDASESPFASQDAVYDDSIEAMMKGNVTGTKVAVFGRFGNDIEQYLAKRSYFNNKKESVQVIAENLTGEEDVTLSKYDFNGNLIHEKVLHRSQFGTLQSTIQESEFVYDHNGRALKHYIGLNGQPKQLISKTSYNEREQVSAKRLGATNEAETKFLQTVNYGYDILNRLVSINNPDNCGDSHISVIGKGGRGLKQLKGKETPVSTISDDIFAMKFYYDQTKTGLSISPQFNNNVSALEYRDGCDALKKGYGFVYDNRDRLVSAQYAAANAASVFSSDNTYSLENVDYDENGNITALKRNGLSGLGMDDLDYTIGLNNQLEYIEELGDN
ncbi:MAG: DUF6443 domain-containing protein, partial [Flavobacteriales bacterium]|nr:DUF6443 domain-containing protein [Flavobacteriales bacterium]